MSSIKKFVKGGNNEWMKFAETNPDIKELSSALNVHVDFNDKSVNELLIEHEQQIQKLKRNVSWLALHGGGGSGTGSGSSTTTRKASCDILINDQSGTVSITEGNDVAIKLNDVKPATDTTTPWTILVYFDGTFIKQYSKALNAGSTDITISLGWSDIKKYFSGSNLYKTHTIKIAASFKNEETQVEGSKTVERSVFIPQVTVSFPLAGTYKTTDSSTKVNLRVETALTGKIKMIVKSYNNEHTFEYNTEWENKTSDVYSKEIDALDLYREDGTLICGVFYSDVYVYYKQTDSSNEQLIYTSTYNQVSIISDTITAHIMLKKLSYDISDPTVVIQSIKSLSFSFYAIAYQQTDFKYNITLTDLLNSKVINVVTGADGKYDEDTIVTKVISDLQESYKYRLDLIINNLNGSQVGSASGYIECSQGEYSFVNYLSSSGGGEYTKLFAIDPFNMLFNDELKTNNVISVSCTDSTVVGAISANMTFNNINARSGCIEDVSKVKVIRMYDMYSDISPTFNSFKKQDKPGGGTEIVSQPVSLSAEKQFTVCICFEAVKYVETDHTIFSILNNETIENGVAIKTDGLYIKNKKKLDLTTNKPTTIHFIYDNSEGSPEKWGSNSTYKVYVDGVLTLIDTECPFAIDGNTNLIQNQKLMISLNGYGTSRTEQCNVDIYSLEIFRTVLNELDILGSTLNNTLRTNYKDGQPDWELIPDVLNKNACLYDSSTKTIESKIYEAGSGYNKYNFNTVLLMNNGADVPQETKEKPASEWISDISSLQMPIVYLDIADSTHQDAQYWDFSNFIQHGDGLEGYQPEVNFYYWDPSTKQMPISADTVQIKIQGTSSREYDIKNIQITFQSKLFGSTEVKDLFFVKKDWIPENSYVLKADIVDSSHANNASIGSCINKLFGESSNIGFDFDKIVKTNISNTRDVLTGSEYNWTIEPTLKHTVEGFQTLLFVKFYGETKYMCLGIYSFNIGREAARNLGFENITNIYTITDEASLQKEKITYATAPSILTNTVVETETADDAVIYWIENSDTHNFADIQNWTHSMQKFTPIDQSSVLSAQNPDVHCRFWHGVINADDTKLDNLFEVKYTNELHKKSVSNITTFKTFVNQIAALPVEGLIYSASDVFEQTDIKGSYTTYTYNGSNYVKYGSAHELVADDLDRKVNMSAVDEDRISMYYMMALLFGLVDNLDKNISFRVINDKIYLDFYDMDTAFGLNNNGDEDVSPTVGMKQIYNVRDSNNVDFPSETYNPELVKDQYDSKYQKFFPETYSNKIWMSMDTNAIRTLKAIGYSLYTSTWFKLRNYLDKLAIQEGYTDFVEYFVEEFFGNQTAFGTMIYNYDYMIKYLNDYEQTGKYQTNSETEKMHGIRTEYIRTWFRQHVDFLDSYFFWRGQHTFEEGNTALLATDSLKTFMSDSVSLTLNSSLNHVEIETIYPVVIYTSLGAEKTKGDTVCTDKKASNIRIVSGDGGKAMTVYGSSLVKEFPLTTIGTKIFKAESGKLQYIEELNLNNLTISKNGIILDDFFEEGSESLLKTIKMNNTTFASTFDLDLNKQNFLNVNYIDIADSKGINTLTFYRTTENTQTQNLVYLNIDNSEIENFYLHNQSMIMIPSIAKCKGLVTYIVEDCDLKNATVPEKTLYSGVDISCHNVIKTIRVKNVYQSTYAKIDKCKALESVTFSQDQLLSSIHIANCSCLTSLTIQECPNLKSIDVTDCEAVPQITILSAPSLTSLNLNNDSSISSIYISKDSVQNIRTINIRNVDISGFNYYNYNTKSYDDIEKDPDDNLILDFKYFTNLNSDGVTIKRERDTSYKSDKCANFQAIRFPNRSDRSYSILGFSWGNPGNFSNLKRIYGHIYIGDYSCYESYNYPKSGLFFSGTVGEDTYTGLPKLYTQLSIDNAYLQTHTVLDDIELSTSLSSCFTNCNDTLSGLESYINNGFLSASSLSIDEFDTREWATNYTVASLHEIFTNKTFNANLWQYFIYRYSIYSRANQKNKTVHNFNMFAAYSAPAVPCVIPSNTFRFLGNTITSINRIIAGERQYALTYDICKYFHELKDFNSVTTKTIIAYNAFKDCTNLTGFGYTGTDGSYIINSGIQISGDTNNQFFVNTPNIKQIWSFSPTNISLSGYVFPAGVQTITDSFKNQTGNDIIDLKSLFSSNNGSLRTLQLSFGTAPILMRPCALSNCTGLTTLALGTNAKYLVEDRIDAKTFLNGNVSTKMVYDVYTDDGQIEEGAEPAQYDQTMMDDVMNSIISACTQLTNIYHLYDNAKIPYHNVSELSLVIPADILKRNTLVQNASYLFQNVNFKYGILSGMFRNMTNLKDVSYLFYRTTPALSIGLTSDIPYKLFYQGNLAMSSVTFTGSDRFDNATDLVSYSAYKTELPKTYYPTSVKVVGRTSYSFNDISSFLSSSGILNEAAYAEIKDRIIGKTEGCIDISDLTYLRDTYEQYCPILSVVKDINENIVLSSNDNVSALYLTLSTIFNQTSALTAWQDIICDLSTTRYSFDQYRRNITNIDYCFCGNPKIAPYSGVNVDETNQYYNPFKCNYNSANQTLKANNSRNTYLTSNAYSNNGKIYMKTADGDFVIDPDNYLSDNYNVTTKDMTVLSSVSADVSYMRPDDPAKKALEIEGGAIIQDSQFDITIGKKYTVTWPDYVLLKSAIQEFRYICAPDLLRYCSNSIIQIDALFKDCDMFSTGDRDYEEIYPNSYTTSLVYRLNCGINGRIPPTLLWPLTELKHLTNIFVNCCHLTGYEKNKQTYVIPEEIFKYSKQIKDFASAFKGTNLMYSADIVTPFSYLTSGSTSDGSISINSIFSRCIWINTPSVNGFMQGRYFNDINYAFYSCRGMGVYYGDLYSSIRSYGCFIGTNVTYTIFTNANRIPSLIKQTYYNSNGKGIGNEDYAYSTLNNSDSVTPKTK